LALPDNATYQMGRADAKHDVERNALTPIGLGSPTLYCQGFYNEWQKFVREKYGVEIQWLDRRTTDTQKVEDYFRGYNEVMVVEIERRFGTNFMERTFTEASKIYQHDHPEDANRL